MKRCPQCNRVESEERLTFCRVDGTPLVRESGAPGEGAGTLRFGPAPATGDTETRIRPTVEALNRPAAPTTVLGGHRAAGETGELGKPKSRRAVVVVAALIAVALAAFAYVYLSRGKNNTSVESIAVLPFVNESGDSDVEYLSDGMTETLIGSLSRLPNLNVKARSSVFRYKGRDADARTVGRELNVQAILTGRVVQRGGQLILSLELVDAKTENVIWSEQYNRRQADLVSLQTEIARDVSNKLRVKLSGADEQRLANNYTENSGAYQLYLRGRFYWNKRTPQDFQKAIEYFNQAVALDPNYALAYTGLADSYALLSNFGARTRREAMLKAREFALKALSLDANLAEAHAALGVILATVDYDFAGGEREYRRAIELNPNYATARQWYGELLSSLGRFEESFAEFRRALEIDPLSLPVNWTYGVSLYHARRYDEAIAQLKKTLELDANFPGAHLSLSLAYEVKGDYAASVEEAARFSELIGNQRGAQVMREGFAKGGWQGFLRTMTEQSQPDKLKSRYIGATFHTELGERDKAFAELNKAYEDREFFMTLLKVDPRLDPLRSDPRFAELMRKVGLPQ